MILANHPTAIVIGAGIVGLATAKALAEKGYQVTVYERHPRALGASIRNFGMVWPVGQPAGEPFSWAVQSRDTWKAVCTQAGVWHEQVGSLHLAYSDVEQAVLEDYVLQYRGTRSCAILTAAETLRKSPAANPEGLKGALWSAEEVIVDPREAIGAVADFLAEQRGVRFRWNTCVSRIVGNSVYVGDKPVQQADVMVLCSGADFETLYPGLFGSLPITKCKLQMMRFMAQPDGWRIGPPLCGGLSLLHYGSFLATPSIQPLRDWAEREMAEYLKWGIHVMVSQHGNGELTIGDSHEYGLSPDPFDRQSINKLIVDYLERFARFKDRRLVQSWNGVYAKMTNGQSFLFEQADDHVYVLNALSGAGMTLSFGLAAQLVENRL